MYWATADKTNSASGCAVLSHVEIGPVEVGWLPVSSVTGPVWLHELGTRE